LKKQFLKEYLALGRTLFDLSEAEFKKRLTQFLYSPKGSKYR
jgi:hypothetical protein